MTREQWQTVVDQDLNGFYNILQATLPQLKAWGGGSYVHLGSAGHLRWPERDVMSVAPKAAIEALITGIAREEGRHKIRANTVLLGVIEAGMFLELTQTGRLRRSVGARSPEEPGAQALGQARGDRACVRVPRIEPCRLRDRTAHRGGGRLWTVTAGRDMTSQTGGKGKHMSESLERVLSGRSWEEFCDTLKAAGQVILRPETPQTEIDRAEGWRYLTRLMRVGCEMMLECADTDFPTFYSASHTTAKIGGDNPDNLYLNATIDGRREYRIRGTRGTVHYLSFGTRANRLAVDGTMIETGNLATTELKTERTAVSRSS